MTPAELMPVAVDTNIIFSALLRPDHRFLRVLMTGPWSFHVTETVLTELFRHKEKIVRASRVSPDELSTAHHRLLSRLEFHKEGLIPSACWDEARALCHDVDPGDTAHVALALALDGLLWTGDKHLRDGLLAKGFDRFFTPW